MMETSSLARYPIMFAFLCALMTCPAVVEAKTHYFHQGDAFFISHFKPDRWLGIEAGARLELNYFTSSIMRCGTAGAQRVEVAAVPEHFNRFVEALPALENKGEYWIMFYPRGYDPNAFGFGLRYNEAYWSLDNTWRNDALAWMSHKYAAAVPPVALVEGALEMDQLDVYIFGGAPLSNLVNTRENTLVYRWRGGKGDAMRFVNARWRVVGKPAQQPLSANSTLGDNVAFPRFTPGKRQLRKLQQLRERDHHESRPVMDVMIPD